MAIAEAIETTQELEMPVRWTPLFYHSEQDKLWNTQVRFVGVPAGRGSGKTELAKRRLVRFLPVPKPWPDSHYFFGGPTQGQAKRIAWDDLKALIPPEWIASISESELRIRTVFGSHLYVLGLDEPWRAAGKQWDGCVLDESSDLKQAIFDTVICPALTHRNGWAWRIGIPRRRGPSYLEFRKFCELGLLGTDPETACFRWPSADIVPAEALRWAREHLDPVDYREQFEATFEEMGGRIFHAFSQQENVRPCAYDPQRPLVIGSDFNVDPMAWAIGHRYPNRMEWIDEIWLRDANTQKTLDVLWGRYQTHKAGFEFYGDATSQRRETSASESDYKQIFSDKRFQAAGRSIFYPQANPGVLDRFASCNAMFCNAAGQRRMYVDPRCKRLIDDLDSRHYKPGTNIVEDAGDLGHMTDAMGYPVHWLYPVPLEIHSQVTGRVIVTHGGR